MLAIQQVIFTMQYQILIIKSSVVTGETSITIPADQAIIAVIIPAGSTITYDLEKSVLANNVIIDFNSNQSVTNHPPRIKSLSSEKQIVTIGDSKKYIVLQLIKIMIP